MKPCRVKGFTSNSKRLANWVPVGEIGFQSDNFVINIPICDINVYQPTNLPPMDSSLCCNKSPGSVLLKLMLTIGPQ